MTVLSDRWIKKIALEKEMIKPFIPEQKKDKKISYGLSSFTTGSGSEDNNLFALRWANRAFLFASFNMALSPRFDL